MRHATLSCERSIIMKAFSRKFRELFEEAALAMAMSCAGQRGDMETVIMLQKSMH